MDEEYVCQDCGTIGLPGVCADCGGTMIFVTETTDDDSPRYPDALNDDLDADEVEKVAETPAPATGDFDDL